MGGSKVIGRNIPRLDALEKVTGKAKFGSDTRIANMLYAKVLRSPYPHARILGIDALRAETLPGVRAVLLPKDVPRIPISPLLGDQFALCSDHVVRCVGDPVAAVAADTLEIAEDALGLIEVAYEELPSVFDVQEAYAANPKVIVHPDLDKYVRGSLPIRLDPERPNVCQAYKIRKGDVERGFREADLVVGNRFTTARIQHCPLECHFADARFEADGSLTVNIPGQETHAVKRALCKLLQLPPSKVRILTSYVGGGFGGKSWVRAEVIAALLSQKSRRPVRLIFTREDMFAVGGVRAGTIVDLKDGVRKDGTLVAREIRAMFDVGAYSEYMVLLVRRCAAGAVGTYRIPNFKLDTIGVYTNTPLTCAFRGFGCPEIEWAIEQQMDILAEKIGIDPIEIREKNILNEGERDVSGMITRSMGAKECLNKVKEWIGWGGKPMEEPAPWRSGKGVAVGNKSVMPGSTSVVSVKVWQDGMVEIRHSAAELGQGIKTTLAQIAAEEFDIPVERIRVVSGDTDICSFDLGTIASRSLVHNGNALLAACHNVKQQLFNIAGEKLEANPEDLVTSAGRIYVKGTPAKSISIVDLFTPLGIPLMGGEIVGIGSYTGPVESEDPETGQSGRSVFTYSHAANAVEVAVNTETGEVKVLREGLACDVGKAINPRIVEGQIEGAIAMGIGTALYEQVIMNEGKVINASFTDYRIPTTLDMPRGANSKAIVVEALEPEGPFGAKGMGELPLVVTGPAIANGVYNAVGVRIKDLPLTKEKVLEGLKKMQCGGKESGIE